MSLCARAVALWLAACALAARAQVVRPQCTHPNCKWLRTEGHYEVYSINGVDTAIYVDGGNTYKLSCGGIAIDNQAFPSLPHPLIFNDVELINCSPPSTSYTSALRALNVTVNSKLSLTSVPDHAKISNASFAELSHEVEDVEISSRNFLMLEPGALAELDNVRRLKLSHVRANQLPKYLQYLQLKYTGLKVIPLEALNVEILTIREDNLLSINGSTPNLKDIQLDAPQLVSLALFEAESQLLREGIVENCKKLQVLQFSSIITSGLPPRLLKNANSLIKFSYTNGQLTTLPPDLFIHSPKLQIIDVSHNDLETLPSKLFAGLRELKVLRLNNNLLTEFDMTSLGPLTTLTTLNLTWNPLGDFCPPGNLLTPLHHLQELALADTKAQRICPAWLRELPALHHLDLHSNEITNVTCADLRVPCGSEGNNVTIELWDNSLEWLNGTLEENSTVEYLAFHQVELRTDSTILCNCSCIVSTPPSLTPSSAGAVWPGVIGSLAALVFVIAAAVGARFYRKIGVKYDRVGQDLPVMQWKKGHD